MGKTEEILTSRKLGSQQSSDVIKESLDYTRNRIKEERRRQGLGQTQLATLSGLSDSAIKDIETGRNFYYNTLLLIASGLGVKVGTLVPQEEAEIRMVALESQVKALMDQTQEIKAMLQLLIDNLL